MNSVLAGKFTIKIPIDSLARFKSILKEVWRSKSPFFSTFESKNKMFFGKIFLEKAHSPNLRAWICGPKTSLEGGVGFPKHAPYDRY